MSIGLLGALAAWMVHGASPGLATSTHWAVCYSNRTPPVMLANYDMVVLEPDAHVDLAQVKTGHDRVLAYLSLGEINHARAWWPRFAHASWVLAPDANWPGASLVDPRSPEWQHWVVDTLAPRLLARGYDGFFFDTVDIASYLADQGPRYAGARAGMAALIHALHRKFPAAWSVTNGGLDLVPRIHSDIQGVVAESTFTDYDFAQHAYRRRAASDAAARATRLQRVKHRFGLPIFALEYARSPQDIRWAYHQAREAGFIPYVAPISLDRILPPPAS